MILLNYLKNYCIVKNNIKLYIVFGKAGSGKDFVSDILAHQYGYFIYQADRFLIQSYWDALNNNQSPSREVRDNQARVHIENIYNYNLDIPLVINWVCLQESQRLILKKAFPQAVFIYVNTTDEIIKKRLKKERFMHNITSKQAFSINKEFELPTFYDLELDNNSTESHLLQQIMRNIKKEGVKIKYDEKHKQDRDTIYN